MKLPCGHDSGQEFSDCPVCYHYHHVPGYRAHYDRLAAMPPACASEEQAVKTLLAGEGGCGTCGDSEKKPALAEMAASAAEAYTRWALAGFPRPTAEEAADRDAKCQTCPLRRDNTCGACGCPLRRTFIGVELGKLSLGTERCPDDPPRWNESTNVAPEHRRQ